ncbi:Ankyrin repeat domain-containing protein 50 [Trichoderma lentiforme]|uniref:Ankyrin repeat domain-containing protein 50 n=1 Tax=Trichoderma lentiforme TaxID=1567552 RepID=A0A9P5CB51_9HYPO|nr:Ankyrin repeat domain-containing protein 50 [Trichoderma lentiforme]
MKRVLSINYHQDAAIGRGKRLKTPISDQNLRGNYLQQKANAEYTVGWICAVTTEYVAAQAILDEKHAGPETVSQANQTDYTLGCIGKHNVVIATLPYGEYGTASAATVAADMSHNFPNIRIRLMAGIGGGAPSERNDIRLGDIVVSSPSNGTSGVVQYDYGRMTQGQPFEPTRFLDQPPTILRTAMTGLMAQYECEGHQLEETINIILEKNPRLLGKYSRPHESSDRLYCNTFVHPSNDDSDCAKSCGDDSLIVRPTRTQENSSLVIHYGVIASANHLMKNAIIRDKMSSENDVLCFEMEAGGLMNNFPCLVIRGICDYSDSHENKEWQGYAAMAAAAYAKDLINRLPLMDSAAPQSTNNPSSNQLHLQEEKTYPVSDKQMVAILESLRFDQIEARQMTIKNAHAKTCRWLLHKSQYIDWLDTAKMNEHSGFLWIKGKPGTGKSTLMKFALNSAKKTMRDKIIIYFFFNARGEDLERSTLGMYRSLLLQLLEKLPALQNILELPRAISKPGKEYHWTTEILINLLDQAIQNLKESSIICFIDALDECEENQIRNMIRFFERVGESATAGSFRVCFSSRHYPHISISKGLNLILEGQEGHTQDMITYINSELKIGDSDLADEIRTELHQKASGVFMWVILVVDILNKEHDKGRIHILKKRLQEIPADLHALFRDILTRDREDTYGLLLCIQWVLFTKQPLRPEQLYFALLSDHLLEWNSSGVTVSVMERFILNHSKGLTEVTKSKVPTVQFIHESVKDYLLKENGLRDIWPDLPADVRAESHERLKQCCLNHIAFGKTAYPKIGAALAKASSEEAKNQRQSTNASSPFLEYAVKNVLHHANEAEASGINQAEFLKEFPLDDWIQLDNYFERHEIRRHQRDVSFLYILAELNMGHLIRRHPDRTSFLKIESERYGTPIFAALATNSSESTRVFLDVYLEIEPSFRGIVDDYYASIEKNGLGRTFKFSPKHCFRDFVIKGTALAAAFSLEMTNMSVEQLKLHSQNYLHIAVGNGHKSILKLFLNKGAYLDHQELLLAAISNGHESIANLLLANGAKMNDIDKNGRAFLSIAAEKGLYSLVEESLNSGAEFDIEYKGRTLLSYAAHSGSEAIVKLLLEKGAKIDTEDHIGRTPLSYAAESGSQAIVQLLLKKGAEINNRDHDRRTPLHYGANIRRNETVLGVLLHGGAEIDAKDSLGMTPLFLAAACGGGANVQLLLDRGANINLRNSVGRTPLSHAFVSKNWYPDITYTTCLLIQKGADINVKDDNGRTPLSYAAMEYYNKEAAEMLLKKGAEVDARDNDGRTPLSHAAASFASGVISSVLLKSGAEIEAKDNNGRTPLSYAAETGNYLSGRPLLTAGAEVNVKDNDGRTPYIYGERNGRINVLDKWVPGSKH